MLRVRPAGVAGVEERFTFLQDSCSKLLAERTPDEEAVLLIRCDMSGLILERGDTKECKRVLDECGEKIDGLTGCQNQTYSSYYWAVAMYKKHVGDAEAYFKSALQFLGYVNLSDIPQDHQVRSGSVLVLHSA